MTGFLYSLLITLLDPTRAALLLLLIATMLPRRAALQRLCVGSALAGLLVCGNGWVVSWMLRSLEWHHLPANPMPSADAIVVLGGGTAPRVWPRPTVEVGDAGDRVLYAAELFRRGGAPLVIVSGHVSTGGLAPRPIAEDMAELLTTIGVPASAIVIERKAENTHDHAVYVCAMLQERQIARVLLVTSAVHMRRALGVFRRDCGSVDYVPAPTDFRTTTAVPEAWYRTPPALVPTSRAFVDFSDAAHEYVGIGYYRLRGWL